MSACGHHTSSLFTLTFYFQSRRLCARSCRWVVCCSSKPMLVAHTFAHSGKSMQKRIYADRYGSSDGGKLPLADTPHQVKSNSKLTQRGGHSLPRCLRKELFMGQAQSQRRFAVGASLRVLCGQIACPRDQPAHGRRQAAAV